MSAKNLKIKDQEDDLKKVILVFNDFSTKVKEPRETLSQARERLENPENPYNKNNDPDSPMTEDVENLLIPEMNKLGSYIDVAYHVLCNRGLSSDKAWDLISKLMQSEVFE